MRCDWGRLGICCDNIARTGWTTGDLLAALDHAKPQSNFDLVMLLIGVNNQYQGRTTIEYQQQFAELLRRSITAASGNAGHVIVLSIPDWGVMPSRKEAIAKRSVSKLMSLMKLPGASVRSRTLHLWM